MHVLLGVTGSVAAIKTQNIVDEIVRKLRGVEVRVVPTEAALHFFGAKDIVGARVHVDAEEWEWRKVGDPVLHIELRKWADVMLVAPLHANTLAKIANGLCVNLLTSTIRAWQCGQKPFLVAPAMNTAMWLHPITSSQLTLLQSWGTIVIPPVSKLLACGDVGEGGLATVTSIVDALISSLRELPPKL